MTMTKAKFTLALLLMLPAAAVAAGPTSGTSGTGDQSPITVAVALPAAALQGTWIGTFRSKHAHIAPFTLTLLIDSNMLGHIIGPSGLTSYCLLKNADLQVITDGSRTVLAGTDPNGNTLTFDGTVDDTGTVLDLNYWANGSATGNCETDDGTAHLVKQ